MILVPTDSIVCGERVGFGVGDDGRKANEGNEFNRRGSEKLMEENSKLHSSIFVNGVDCT